MKLSRLIHHQTKYLRIRTQFQYPRLPTLPLQNFIHSSPSPESNKYTVKKQKTKVGSSRGQSVDIYHEIHGSGKHKLLFITGWAGSCENWKFQTEFFGMHGDFEVCIFENRGSGLSSIPESKYSMGEMAHDAYDLIQQLGWNSVHVVGVSMGGMIAQEFAVKFPKLVSSLTLASTTAGGEYPPSRHIPWLMNGLARLAFGLEQISDRVPLMLYSKNWLTALASESTKETNIELIKKFHKSRTDDRPPQSTFAAASQMYGILRHKISPYQLRSLSHYLSTSSIPALVIHGTEDVLVQLKSAFFLAQNLSAKLVIFEGRGHAMNHEDTGRFNEVLLRHFKGAIERVGKLGSGKNVNEGEEGSKVCSEKAIQKFEKVGSLSTFQNIEAASGIESVHVIRADRDIDSVRVKDWIYAVPEPARASVAEAILKSNDNEGVIDDVLTSGMRNAPLLNPVFREYGGNGHGKGGRGKGNRVDMNKLEEEVRNAMVEVANWRERARVARAGVVGVAVLFAAIAVVGSGPVV